MSTTSAPRTTPPRKAVRPKLVVVDVTTGGHAPDDDRFNRWSTGEHMELRQLHPDAYRNRYAPWRVVAGTTLVVCAVASIISAIGVVLVAFGYLPVQ